MSVRVIDRLEVVDIEHQDPERALGTDRTRVLLAKSGEPEAPVVGIGQWIDRSQPLKSVVGQGVVDGQPEIGAEPFQQMLGIRLLIRSRLPARPRRAAHP